MIRFWNKEILEENGKRRQRDFFLYFEENHCFYFFIFIFFLVTREIRKSISISKYFVKQVDKQNKSKTQLF